NESRMTVRCVRSTDFSMCAGARRNVTSTGFASKILRARGMPQRSARLRPARKLLALGYAMPQMNEAVADTVPVARAMGRSARPSLVLLVVGLFWLELINQLRAEWWLNPQYNYGLIVPALTFYLFWKRWRNRPSPFVPRAPALGILLVLFAAAFFLPIRF